MRLEHSYAQLPEMFHVSLVPQAWPAPRLVIFNHALAGELGILSQGMDSQELADIFSGNRLPEHAKPIAQAYAGHQFGHFTMLGDGRALLLGELVTSSGERVDIQFKGSGPTVFSRGGDGLAALGPMLREYIISEAMHALGIATTRSLAVVATGVKVRRETFLDGAVLTRVASSHLRVGTFQYAAARRDPQALRALVDYALWRHAPELLQSENKALALLEEVSRRQSRLIAQWLGVGFIHGVMNTDNMTISGQTIDYGPCAFMDRYDPATVFSSIDHNGRYAFANQPAIAQWNLARLAEALLGQIDSDPDKAIKLAEPVVQGFRQQFLDHWLSLMGRKVGILQRRDQDAELIQDLLEIMHKDRLDYTGTFVMLTDRVAMMVQGLDVQEDAQWSAGMRQWIERWQERVRHQDAELWEILSQMQTVNPVYIPRNHLVEAALQAATNHGDLQPLHELLQVMSNPYFRQHGRQRYAETGPLDETYRTFCGT